MTEGSGLLRLAGIGKDEAMTMLSLLTGAKESGRSAVAPATRIILLARSPMHEKPELVALPELVLALALAHSSRATPCPRHGRSLFVPTIPARARRPPIRPNQ